MIKDERRGEFFLLGCFLNIFIKIYVGVYEYVFELSIPRRRMINDDLIMN